MGCPSAGRGPAGARAPQLLDRAPTRLIHGARRSPLAGSARARPTSHGPETQRGGPAMSFHDAHSSRREFLGRSLRLTIAVGVAPACLALEQRADAAGPLVKFSHGTGLCNMPLFYAGEKKLFAKYGANAEVVLTVPGTATIQLASGQVEMAVLPYTSAIAAYTRSPGFSVISGSGIQGLQVVA